MRLSISLVDQVSYYEYGQQKWQDRETVKVADLDADRGVIAGLLRTIADEISPDVLYQDVNQ